MELWRRSIGELIAGGKRALGFWGAPPRAALEEASARHPGAPWLDLDVFREAPRSRAVPEAFCHIIRNCVDNALTAAGWRILRFGGREINDRPADCLRTVRRVVRRLGGEQSAGEEV